MIKLSDHLYIEPMGRLLERERAEKAEKIKHRREYAAAKISRLNNGWITYTTTANYEHQISLAALQARSRQMFRDVSHFKKYQSMCVSNVVGRQGIRLQCRAYKLDGKTLDRKLNKYIERKFWEWGFRENCSASGKISWQGYQELLMRILPRDGEVLFQKIKDNSRFGFRLKQIDVTYLDPLLNRDLTNGNRIIMSVEVDDDYRPQAYWLTMPASDSMFALRSAMRKPIRLPASEMIHIYLPSDDESQTRGVPWAHAAILDAKHMYGYKEGTIISARAQANQIGFIEQDPTDDIQFEGEEDPETGIKRNIEINNEPGQWNLLEPGMKANLPNLTQPSQNHSEFYKSMGRDEAVGLDVNYFTLFGDYAEVNLSSGRLGLNEERDVWRMKQTFVADTFCREVYHEVVMQAWLSGEIKLTARQFDEVQNPLFRGRGWDYMDPAKEIGANAQALENKLTTWTALYAEKGLDIIDVFEEMQQEQALAAEYGIELKAVSTVKATDATAPGEDPNATDNPPAGEKKRGYSNGHAEVIG